ncbi:type II toxin-antitoxin system VapB family antitoxin [Sphingomonas cannabina]|uniref:type II toxin-antitoxin system VapB family antitoxin n=1 Tax=Sphingomonas cannabina TaxID=2899123 RepID=UPI001F480760|nr:type II toxin-antitoxin system VapB family antitoxin [Sphingomonas cannabina]UIJ44454.1 type II toxin-antitoxin system VapB family antitoxin [Sphingomonas cannabina]
MGVQLNIKSAEARALAEELAEATGESITEAITAALRLRLRQIALEKAKEPNAMREREMAFYRLIRGSRMRWKGAMLSVDHGDLLYDEHGLPR